MTNEELDILKLNVLTLGLNQVLIVKVDTFISHEMRKKLEELILLNVPMLKDRFLVIDKGITLSVVDIDAG